MSNPVDEYLELTKQADDGGWKKRVGDAAIQTGVGLAVAGLPIAATKIYQAATKNRNFNKMLEHNEDLHAMREQNPKGFNTFYNSLHRMNPEFAADPVVSGTYMRQMLGNPAGAGKTLVEARGERAGSGPLQDVFSKMAPGVGKSMTESKEQDPLADQRKRVQGLELEAKERDLASRLSQP